MSTPVGALLVSVTTFPIPPAILSSHVVGSDNDCVVVTVHGSLSLAQIALRERVRGGEAMALRRSSSRMCCSAGHAYICTVSG